MPVVSLIANYCYRLMLSGNAYELFGRRSPITHVKHQFLNTTKPQYHTMVNFAGLCLGFITLLIWCPGAISVKPTHELANSYTGQSFLDGFDFITADDPNGGYVEYVNRNDAVEQSLAYQLKNKTCISVAGWEKLEDDAKGRKSVWLESRFTFGVGMLMIAKFEGMPGSRCGTWPSFYTINKHSSDHFTEVDLYEGANLEDRNEMTVWIGEKAGCKGVSGDVHFTKAGGAVRSSWVYDADGPCSKFYTRWGLTLAMSIENDKIRAWQFGWRQEPDEIRREDALLDIDSWPKPTMLYDSESSGCNVGHVFSNQTLALKVNFCGSKACGTDWELSGCAAQTGMSCEQWVQTRPIGSFMDTSFQIEYIKLFKMV